MGKASDALQWRAVVRQPLGPTTNYMYLTNEATN